MCSPAAVPFAIQGAQMLMQQQQAKVAWAQYDRMTTRVAEGAADELAEARRRQRQEREAVVAEIIAATERTRGAFASAEVAGAEAGIAGPALDAYLNTFVSSELQARLRGEQQIEGIDDAADAASLAFRRRTREQLMAARPGIMEPSLIDLGLGLASAGIQSHQINYDLNNPETP